MKDTNSVKSKRIVFIATLTWVGLASLAYMYQFHQLLGKVFQLFKTF